MSLQMTRGKLKQEDFQCIQENYVYLKENIEALDIVDYLFQSKVLTLDDKEKISKKKAKSERNEIMLRALLHAGPEESFNNFLLSLEGSYKHVLKKLKQTGRPTTFDEMKATDDKVKAKMNHIFELNKKLGQAQEALRQNEQNNMKLQNAYGEALEALTKERAIVQVQTAYAQAFKSLETKEAEIVKLKEEIVTANETLNKKDNESVRAIAFKDFKSCIETAIKKGGLLNDKGIRDFWSDNIIYWKDAPWKKREGVSAFDLVLTFTVDRHLLSKKDYISKFYGECGSSTGAELITRITWLLHQIGLETIECVTFWEEYETCLRAK